MSEQMEQAELLAALRNYLEDLQESGVDGLPVVSETAAPVYALSVAEHEPHFAKRSAEDAAETLETIREALGDCQRCALSKTRSNLVFGVGNAHAELLFLGEAPGQEEDRQGEPFVGEAGQLLTKIITAMGFQRSDVYICNILKCRPPGNRNPLPPEIEQCGPFMERQIRGVSPKAIVALGTFAAQTLLNSKKPISQLRGHFHDYNGISVMPTFHPAFLLRSPERKREVWDDMKQVMALLGKEPK